MEYRFSCTTGEPGTGDKLYFYTTDMFPAGEMRGTFAVDRGPKTLECSNKFPAYTCAAYFTEWLSERGIICTEGPADTGFFAPAGGCAPQDSLTMLGRTVSPSLDRIAFMTNHDSNNVYAETLYHTLGKERWGQSGYLSSRQLMRKLLQEKGLNPRTIVIQDGSGLSRENLLSAEFLCGFLEKMMSSPSFGEFFDSLPFPGGRGTLEFNMRSVPEAIRTRIRMKSGSMGGVRCFSGYIVPETGTKDETVIFSILVNGYTVPLSRIQKGIDNIILSLTGWETTEIHKH